MLVKFDASRAACPDPRAQNHVPRPARPRGVPPPSASATFLAQRGRWWSAVTDLGRVNHSMHNQSMTFDNQATIMGGRNIGDEHFYARQEISQKAWITF